MTDADLDDALTACHERLLELGLPPTKANLRRMARYLLLEMDDPIDMRFGLWECDCD